MRGSAPQGTGTRVFGEFLVAGEPVWRPPRPVHPFGGQGTTFQQSLEKLCGSISHLHTRFPVSWRLSSREPHITGKIENPCPTAPEPHRCRPRITRSGRRPGRTVSALGQRRHAQQLLGIGEVRVMFVAHDQRRQPAERRKPPCSARQQFMFVEASRSPGQSPSSPD